MSLNQKNIYITIIDAIAQGKRTSLGEIVEPRNHRFRVTHTCEPEALLKNIQESVFDFLATEGGQELFSELQRTFTYDEVTLVPSSFFQEHGIESFVAEKARTKITVDLTRQFGGLKQNPNT